MAKAFDIRRAIPLLVRALFYYVFFCIVNVQVLFLIMRLPGESLRWWLHISGRCALLTSAAQVGHPEPGTRPPAKERAIPAKVFVGNLSFQTTKERLQEFLAPAGNILDVALPTDRESGRPRGFAFVEYASDAEAAACIAQFNGQELDGRPLRVNAAADRPRRPGGFGGGGGHGGPPQDGGDFFGGHRPFKSKGSRRGLRARKRGG